MRVTVTAVPRVASETLEAEVVRADRWESK